MLFLIIKDIITIERRISMLKRIAKTVLNVMLFLGILIVTFLTIFRSLFLENANAKSLNDLNLEEIKNLTKYSSGDIHDWIDDYLKEYDIPIEVLDEVEEEQKQIVNEYIKSFIVSSKNKENIPEIPEEKIKSVMTKGINAYNKKYNTNISVEKVNALIHNLTSKLESVLSIIHQNISFFGWFRFLLNDTVYYSFIVITILLLLIMIFTYRKESLFSLGGISIFEGIVLLGIYTVFKISSFQNILEFLPFDTITLKSTLLNSGMIYVILGFLLLTIYKVVDTYMAKKVRNKINQKIIPTVK